MCGCFSTTHRARGPDSTPPPCCQSTDSTQPARAADPLQMIEWYAQPMKPREGRGMTLWEGRTHIDERLLYLSVRGNGLGGVVVEEEEGRDGLQGPVGAAPPTVIEPAPTAHSLSIPTTGAGRHRTGCVSSWCVERPTRPACSGSRGRSRRPGTAARPARPRPPPRHARPSAAPWARPLAPQARPAAGRQWCGRRGG